MKRLVRFAIPLLVVASFFITCQKMHAQALAPVTVERAPVTRALELQTTPKVFSYGKVEFELKYSLMGEQYSIIARANPSEGIYGVIRNTPNGKTSFGRGERFFKWYKSNTPNVKVKGKIDLTRPYTIRKKKTKFIISQRKTREVDEMFNTLDDMLVSTVVPAINSERSLKPKYSKLQAGESLTAAVLDQKVWK